MSLSLDELKSEIVEYQNRVEEVLTGMDSFLVRLDQRISKLEGQLATLAEALSGDAMADSLTIRPRN
jgi:hypothetical protein